LKIDLHTHTIASGHAFNTIYEMAAEAKKRGVKILGITEHGPAVLGSATNNYFSQLYRLPRKILGVKMLFGAELNILNKKGEVDLPEWLLQRCDYLSAGLHQTTSYEGKSEKENTQAMLAAMANPQINTLNHIYRIVFPVNIEKVAQTACDQGKLLEISIAVFSKKKIPDEVVERISRMIKVVKQNKQKILLGSDAHIATEIGEDKGFNKYKKKLGLTAKDIANNDIKYLRKFVKNI